MPYNTKDSFQYPAVTPQLLDEVVGAIVAAGTPLKIVLFGSRARGNAKPHSDIDLLVIEESNLPKYRRAARYYVALADFLLGQDIVVRTPAEIEEWREEPNALVTTALREGKVLYERAAKTN